MRQLSVGDVLKKYIDARAEAKKILSRIEQLVDLALIDELRGVRSMKTQRLMEAKKEFNKLKDMIEKL